MESVLDFIRRIKFMYTYINRSLDLQDEILIFFGGGGLVS